MTYEHQGGSVSLLRSSGSRDVGGAEEEDYSVGRGVEEDPIHTHYPSPESWEG